MKRYSCMVPKDDGVYVEYEVAAQLLAALAAMLEEYEGVYDCLSSNGEQYQSTKAQIAEEMARLAIKKAKGEE